MLVKESNGLGRKVAKRKVNHAMHQYRTLCPEILRVVSLPSQRKVGIQLPILPRSDRERFPVRVGPLDPLPLTPESVFKAVKQDFPVKLRKTNTPEATVRRTLQELEAEGFLTRVERGVYSRRNAS